MKAFHFKSLPSTNDKAMELAQQSASELPEFSYVVAEEQTNGRGRNGNSWSSAPAVGLYMSMILRPTLPLEYIPQLTLVAGVAICEVLQVLPQKGRAATIGLKWPNDILINERKVAGILCEASLQGDSATIIVGIGINISATREQLPPRVIYPATSLMLEGIEADPATLAEQVAEALRQRIQQFYKSREIASDWKQYDLLNGTSIKVQTPDIGLVEGIASGITPTGELLVLDPATNICHTITAGSIVRE